MEVPAGDCDAGDSCSGGAVSHPEVICPVGHYCKLCTAGYYCSGSNYTNVTGQCVTIAMSVLFNNILTPICVTCMLFRKIYMEAVAVNYLECSSTGYVIAYRAM